MTRRDSTPPGHPADLPVEALPYWPNLEKWRTPVDVHEFLRSTRRVPHIRLAVINGLRFWAVIDVSPIWAWASGIVTLSVTGLGVTVAVNVGWIQLGVTVAVNVGWIQLIALILAFGLDLLFLSMMVNMSLSADVRRRRADLWLLAFEERM